MYLSSRVLGTTLVKELQTRSSAPVLAIGSDTFTKPQLSRIKCFSFFAAATLSRALSASKLDIKNTSDLFERVPPSALALPRLGVVALAVLGAAFEVKKIGGARPIESWMLKHRDGELRTFYTVKAIVKREAAEKRAEQRTIERRTAARNNAAHEIRIVRHTKRSAA